MPFGIKGAVEVVCGLCSEGRGEKLWKKQKPEGLALRPDLNLGLAAFPATLQSDGQGWQQMEREEAAALSGRICLK